MNRFHYCHFELTEEIRQNELIHTPKQTPVSAYLYQDLLCSMRRLHCRKKPVGRLATAKTPNFTPCSRDKSEAVSICTSKLLSAGTQQQRFASGFTCLRFRLDFEVTFLRPWSGTKAEISDDFRPTCIHAKDCNWCCRKGKSSPSGTSACCRRIGDRSSWK